MTSDKCCRTKSFSVSLADQLLAGRIPLDEALLNLEEPEDLRINYDAALRSTIAGSLQVEIKFKLLYDNVPALQADGTEREKIDTTTTISLIYTLI